MRFTEDAADASYIIDAHGPGWVSINHVMYSSSLIIMPSRLELGWSPSPFSQLGINDLAPIFDMSPEIILIGTGRRQQFPGSDILRKLREHDIGCEFMDTAAACRTYTVLMAEKRLVAAGLFMAD